MGLDINHTFGNTILRVWQGGTPDAAALLWNSDELLKWLVLYRSSRPVEIHKYEYISVSTASNLLLGVNSPSPKYFIFIFLFSQRPGPCIFEPHYHIPHLFPRVLHDMVIFFDFFFLGISHIPRLSLQFLDTRG